MNYRNPSLSILSSYPHLPSQPLTLRVCASRTVKPHTNQGTGESESNRSLSPGMLLSRIQQYCGFHISLANRKESKDAITNCDST